MCYSSSTALAVATPDSFIMDTLGRVVPVQETLPTWWNLLGMVLAVTALVCLMPTLAPKDPTKIKTLPPGAAEDAFPTTAEEPENTPAGGQFAIQGPIMLDAAGRMGADPGLITMAIGYGDALTNMIQPLFALPLLAIAGCRMRDMVGYSSASMLISGPILIVLVFVASLVV
ncbi:TIGR00366 family protein [Brevibacterium litoralis]|uniref:TIGR00366 family protein n=1 Tax=Brevibacterium litoralis TaxID=3138935 RepID=UPI0032EB55C3